MAALCLCVLGTDPWYLCISEQQVAPCLMFGCLSDCSGLYAAHWFLLQPWGRQAYPESRCCKQGAQRGSRASEVSLPLLAQWVLNSWLHKQKSWERKGGKASFLLTSALASLRHLSAGSHPWGMWCGGNPRWTPALSQAGPPSAWKLQGTGAAPQLPDVWFLYLTHPCVLWGAWSCPRKCTLSAGTACYELSERLEGRALSCIPARLRQDFSVEWLWTAQLWACGTTPGTFCSTSRNIKCLKRLGTSGQCWLPVPAVLVPLSR